MTKKGRISICANILKKAADTSVIGVLMSLFASKVGELCH